MTVYDPLKVEPEVLEFWQKNKSFDKLRKKLAGSKKRYSFLDGPITANNPMGVHHAWGRTYKDAFQRFWAMRGYNQRWQNGFDCQGLWIEREVEKEHGFKSKKDIENFGILNFAKECRARVEKFSKLQIKDSIRLGQWMDWGNDYYTFSDTNNEHNWMLLKEYHKRGWLHKGKDAVPWCPRCGTASSKHDIVTEGYKEVTHTGLYTKFPLVGKTQAERGSAGPSKTKGFARENEFILIFTTTPWTVPANVAAAVNENLDYVKVKQGDEFYWIAEVRAPSVLLGDYKIIEKVNGKNLVGLKYEMPYPNMPEQNAAPHKIVAWELATGEEGTGIVHIAPGCGPEDFVLGKKLGMSAPSPLNESGNYQHGWSWLTGEFATTANKKIIDDMQKRGFVYKTEPYAHRYPHCWRCGTELVFRLEDEWYVKANEIRPLLKKANEKIKWYPEYGKVRQDNWFDAMGEWLISRKRFWGLPLPFWECTKCDALEVIGSIKELKQKAIRGMEQLKELHRPWIDAVVLKCPKCKSDMKRVLDVGDAWLDAGIVPFSTIGTSYMQNKKEWEKWYPVDFICENMPGQYRGWFNALLWSSVTLTGVAAFKSILGYETVKDEIGREMHKSLGNAVWADEALNKAGADSMRWRYFLQDPAAELRFGFKTMEESRRNLNVIWNLGEYIKVNLGKKFKPSEPKNLRVEDKWILSRLESTKKAVTSYLENLQPHHATATLQNFFLNDLSRGYVHFVREEFDDNRVQILYKILIDTVKLMAPVVPFMTEKIYQDVFRQFEKSESVHHLDWPEANEKLIETKLESEIGTIKELASTVFALRDKMQRSVRWPIKSAIIVTEDHDVKNAVDKQGELVKRLANVLDVKVQHELKGIKHAVKPNHSTIAPKAKKDTTAIIGELVKLSPESILQKLRTDKKIKVKGIDLTESDFIIEEKLPSGIAGQAVGNYSVYLETEETKEMLASGYTRELTRGIQALRKSAGLRKQDKIEVTIAVEPELENLLAKHLREIKEKVGAADIEFLKPADVNRRKHKDQLIIRKKALNFGFNA